MTLLTALAFVALGFVAGCVALGSIWGAASNGRAAAAYQQGFHDAANRLCPACGDLIERNR